MSLWLIYFCCWCCCCAVQWWFVAVWHCATQKGCFFLTYFKNKRLRTKTSVFKKKNKHTNYTQRQRAQEIILKLINYLWIWLFFVLKFKLKRIFICAYLSKKDEWDFNSFFFYAFSHYFVLVFLRSLLRTLVFFFWKNMNSPKE